MPSPRRRGPCRSSSIVAVALLLIAAPLLALGRPLPRSGSASHGPFDAMRTFTIDADSGHVQYLGLRPVGGNQYATFRTTLHAGNLMALNVTNPVSIGVADLKARITAMMASTGVRTYGTYAVVHQPDEEVYTGHVLAFDAAAGADGRVTVTIDSFQVDIGASAPQHRQVDDFYLANLKASLNRTANASTSADENIGSARFTLAAAPVGNVDAAVSAVPAQGNNNTVTHIYTPYSHQVSASATAAAGGLGDDIPSPMDLLNNAAKEIAGKLVGEIPVIGEVAAFFMAEFWPSGSGADSAGTLIDELRQWVQTYVPSVVDDAEVASINNDARMMFWTYGNFTVQLKAGDLERAKSTWTEAKGQCDNLIAEILAKTDNYMLYKSLPHIVTIGTFAINMRWEAVWHGDMLFGNESSITRQLDIDNLNNLIDDCQGRIADIGGPNDPIVQERQKSGSCAVWGNNRAPAASCWDCSAAGIMDCNDELCTGDLITWTYPPDTVPSTLGVAGGLCDNMVGGIYLTPTIGQLAAVMKGLKASTAVWELFRYNAKATDPPPPPPAPLKNATGYTSQPVGGSASPTYAYQFGPAYDWIDNVYQLPTDLNQRENLTQIQIWTRNDANNRPFISAYSLATPSAPAVVVGDTHIMVNDGPVSSPTTITLAPGEYISRVRAAGLWFVAWLEFTTNTGRVMAFGDQLATAVDANPIGRNFIHPPQVINIDSEDLRTALGVDTLFLKTISARVDVVDADTWPSRKRFLDVWSQPNYDANGVKHYYSMEPVVGMRFHFGYTAPANVLS